MLLYTRLAQPKAPKRRSRAGCAFCKEKKKKCDEQRPQCARCVERGLACGYEAIKPRQRRTRESLGDAAVSVSEKALALHEKDGGVTKLYDDVVNDLYADDYLGLSAANDGNDQAFDLGISDDFVQSPTSPVAPDGLWNSDRQLIALKARRRESSASVVSLPRSKLPDLAMIAPCPAMSPSLEFCAPAFFEFSDRRNRRALVDHFCNVLSHLIVFREESGNPFQQLVLPLSYSSAPVMNAIYALASAHLEYRGVNNEEKSLFFHNQAIQGLTQLIEMGVTVDKNQVLATIMLLVYYEVLVQRGRSSIVDGHLRGALTIMSTTSDESNSTSLFLERAFRFYDVITALSLGTAPLSTAPAAGCLLPFPPMNAAPASPLQNVDTLLGMATTLWPVMHRLSNLLYLKGELDKALRADQSSFKVAVLRSEFNDTSQAIEAALNQWKPYLPPKVVIRNGELESLNEETTVEEKGKDQEKADEDIPTELPRLRSIHHNAMAYRHSASVYLYRTIYEYAPSNPVVQEHAHEALKHCVETISHKGPRSALLWPLFVAACEATTVEDRALADKAFAEIEMRQGMTNIEQAWKVVHEVWARLDAASRVEPESPSSPLIMELSVGMLGAGVGRGAGAPQLWRMVSEEMGVNIVFG